MSRLRKTVIGALALGCVMDALPAAAQFFPAPGPFYPAPFYPAPPPPDPYYRPRPYAEPYYRPRRQIGYTCYTRRGSCELDGGAPVNTSCRCYIPGFGNKGGTVVP